MNSAAVAESRIASMDYVSYAYSYLVSSSSPSPPPPPHPFLSFFAPYVNTLNGLVSSSKLSDPDINVPVVLGFFTLFVFLYILEFFVQPNMHLATKSDRHAWCVKVPSQLHAFLCTIFGWACILDPEMWANPISASSPSAILGCRVISGYMLADLISVLVHFEDEGLPFLVHAIFSFLPYFTSLYTGTLRTFCGSALIAETSTMALNHRLLAIQTGRSKNKVYDLNQAMFFITFIFVRIIVCFFFLTPHFFSMLYSNLTSPGTTDWRTMTVGNLEVNSDVPVGFWVLMLSVFVVMNCLNSFWALSMVKIALGIKRKSKSSSKAKKAVSASASKDTAKRILTLPNLFVYGPVALLFPEDGDDKKGD